MHRNSNLLYSHRQIVQRAAASNSPSSSSMSSKWSLPFAFFAPSFYLGYCFLRPFCSLPIFVEPKTSMKAGLLNKSISLKASSILPRMLLSWSGSTCDFTTLRIVLNYWFFYSSRSSWSMFVMRYFRRAYEALIWFLSYLFLSSVVFSSSSSALSSLIFSVVFWQ